MSDAWWCFWNSNYSINPTTTALSILLLLLTSCITIFLRRKNREEPLPPGPLGVPLLGYLPFLRPDLHQEFTKLSDKYGPIYKLWLGKKLCIVITSPTIAKQVVKEQDLQFASRDATIATQIVTCGGLDIAFAEYGENWRKMRKIFVREMMSNTSVDACSHLRRQEVRKTIRSLYGNKAGHAVDVGELTVKLIFNATMAMVWGPSVEEGKGEGTVFKFRELVTELMVIVGQPNVSDLFPFIARFDIQGIGKKAEKVRQWLHAFFDSIIEGAVAERAAKAARGEDEAAGGGQKKDLIHILLDMQLKDKNFGNTELKAILTDIFIGGTDTTSAAVEWIMARLMYHRDAREKVMEELNRVVGIDNTVEEHHLPELKYLDVVLKEILRLHPLLPLLIPKVSRENTTLGKYKIPKDAKIFVNIWAIQRDPQLWENPEEFRPERFLESSGSFDFTGNNAEYMPFGSGRRICAGIPLAERVAKYVAASLLHSFHWELPQGADELEFGGRFGIVMKISNPLVAIPKTRLSKAQLYM